MPRRLEKTVIPFESTYSKDFKQGPHKLVFSGEIRDNVLSPLTLKVTRLKKGGSKGDSIKTQGKNANVIRKTPQEIIRHFLSNEDGQNIILTGAGISKSAGIPTLIDLENAFGFHEPNFFHRATNNPEEVSEQYRKKVQEALDVIHGPIPEVHSVLAQFAKKHGVTIATTNQDELHDRAQKKYGGTLVRHEHVTPEEIDAMIPKGKKVNIMLYGTSGHRSEDQNYPLLTWLMKKANEKNSKIEVMHVGLGEFYVKGIPEVKHCEITADEFTKHLKNFI